MQAVNRRRLLIWAPFAIVLGAIVIGLFRPQPVPVDLATVERGPLRVSVSDEGETRVRDVFVVSAPVAGRMQRVELDVGDDVIANETLISRIQPSDPTLLDERSSLETQAAVDAAAAAREHARAQIRRAEADLEFAATELTRVRELAERGTVSQNDLDAAQRRARTAEAALQEARAALQMRESEYRQARARLLNPRSTRAVPDDCECVNVYSPVSGTVLQVINESEVVVQPGTPIVELGDPRDLEIVVDLLSADAVRVAPGQKVVIEAWGGNTPLNGVVRRVEPFGFTKISALGIEEQRVNVIIDITDPASAWTRLGHGYRVEPRIILWQAEDVVRVPLSALFRRGGQWAVFVAKDNRAQLRPVELGRENDLRAQVVSGLEPGESIIVHPNDRVGDGVSIEERAVQ